MASTPIEQSWQSFRKLAFPDVTDEAQLADLRKTFFAGAAIVFKGLLIGLSAEDEPTESDMNMMSNIQNELDEFASALDMDYLGPSLGRGKPN